MKRILILVAMLSMLLCAFGTAQAVVGVDDEVPSEFIVMPWICAVDGSLDTLTAVADVFGWGADAFVELHTYDSVFLTDLIWEFTDFDVVSDNCQRWVSEEIGPGGLSGALLTIGGRDYYVGYAIAFIGFPYAGWEYLVDLNKGFASGFNPLQIENNDPFVVGFDTDWDEYFTGTGFVSDAVIAYFPRYLIVNNTLPESWTWWTFIFPFNNDFRYLVGFVCDEEENCRSINVPIPFEVNVINVIDVLPPVLTPSSDSTWAGYGSFLLCDDFDVQFLDYSTTGWSYERAQGSSVAASWDVIHKVHKIPFWDVVDTTFSDHFGIAILE
jgi:hypothetical protein